MLLPLCVVLLAAVVSGCTEPDHRPVVATREGLVRGVTDRSAGGLFFYSFKGIRYARPPLGRLRFEQPQRHPGWQGVADASEHGSKCAQFQLFNNATRVGTEDCLFVNAYSRQLPRLGSSKGGLPVMVNIHGGGFFFGSGDSDELGPHYFMDEAVVLVTFNYRLGPFGFFTTHDAAAPGNYGLLDQVLLLQWVQDNIAAFGGNPKLVTILGESAGGGSVSLLSLSPLAKGLFHHAISQSGVSLGSVVGSSGRRRGLGVQLSESLGCNKGGAEATVDCIRQVSADELQDATVDIGIHNKNVFAPRVDREAQTPFLLRDPRSLLAAGNFSLVPRLMGMTETESTQILPAYFLGNENMVEEVFQGNLTAWSRLSGIVGGSEYSTIDCGADPTEETRKILDFFVGSGPVTLSTVVDVLSDRVFVNVISEEIRLASAHTPVYKYLLDHRGAGRLTFADFIVWPVPANLHWPAPELGVTHLDDLLYLFSNEYLPRERPGSPTYTMIRFMVNLWVNFARTGRPSSDVLEMPEWPIFTEQSQRHMRLNSEPALGERLFGERVNFWKTVRINEPWRHPVQTTCKKTVGGGASQAGRH